MKLKSKFFFIIFIFIFINNCIYCYATPTIVAEEYDELINLLDKCDRKDLYQSYGFQPFGKLKYFYNEDEDEYRVGGLTISGPGYHINNLVEIYNELIEENISSEEDFAKKGSGIPKTKTVTIPKEKIGFFLKLLRSDDNKNRFRDSVIPEDLYRNVYDNLQSLKESQPGDFASKFNLKDHNSIQFKENSDTIDSSSNDSDYMSSWSINIASRFHQGDLSLREKIKYAQEALFLHHYGMQEELAQKENLKGDKRLKRKHTYLSSPTSEFNKIKMDPFLNTLGVLFLDTKLELEEMSRHENFNNIFLTKSSMANRLQEDIWNLIKDLRNDFKKERSNSETCNIGQNKVEIEEYILAMLELLKRVKP